MQVLGNGDQPGIEAVLWIVGVYFVKGAGEGLNGNILGIVLIAGSLQLKMVDFGPIAIQELAVGLLIT